MLLIHCLLFYRDNAGKKISDFSTVWDVFVLNLLTNLNLYIDNDAAKISWYFHGSTYVGDQKDSKKKKKKMPLSNIVQKMHACLYPQLV